jgi:hypothetical protein
MIKQISSNLLHYLNPFNLFNYHTQDYSHIILSTSSESEIQSLTARKIKKTDPNLISEKYNIVFQKAIAYISHIPSMFTQVISVLSNHLNPFNLFNYQRRPAYTKPQLELLTGPKEEIDDERLNKIQKNIEEKKIPLHVCPKRPKESYLIHPEKAEEYIQLIFEDYRAPMKKAVDNIQHISMKKFEGALKTCLQTLETQLNSCPYSVGLNYWKSNQWVASLALKDLDPIPTSHFCLFKPDSKELKTIQPPSVKDVREQTLVLFDDCSYSGNQIIGNLVKIADEMQTNKMNKKTLYLVIPFITKQAKISIENFTKTHENCKNYLDIHLITSEERIKTVNEIFTPEELGQLDKIIMFPNEAFSGPSSGSLYRTLCYTDWDNEGKISTVIGFGNNMMVPGVEQNIKPVKTLEDMTAPETVECSCPSRIIFIEEPPQLSTL